MTSMVHFRMFHGKELEPIPFTGQSIRLIDLKRHIVEKKNIKAGLDFDLEITDGDSGTGRLYAVYRLYEC
jgi:DWNN domain